MLIKVTYDGITCEYDSLNEVCIGEGLEVPDIRAKFRNALASGDYRFTHLKNNKQLLQFVIEP